MHCPRTCVRWQQTNRIQGRARLPAPDCPLAQAPRPDTKQAKVGVEAESSLTGIPPVNILGIPRHQSCHVVSEADHCQADSILPVDYDAVLMSSGRGEEIMGCLDVSREARVPCR